MAEDLTVGTLGIDVEANIGAFERQSRAELKQVAERVGTEAGRSLGTALSGGMVGGARQARAGERTVDEFIKGARRQLERRRAELNEEVARGLLSEQDARKQGQEAGRAFQQSLLREIDRRGRAGNLSDDDYLSLATALKRTGERGAREFMQPMQGLQGWMRTTFAVGVIAAVAYAMTRAVDFVRRGAARIRALLDRGGQATSISEGFGQLVADRGLSAGGTLEALRRGTRGQVADIELMRRSNLALLSDIPLTEAAMERMATVSRRLGQAVGKDAAEAFEYFIRAINTGQSDMLKQLGLTTTLEGALRRYKEETGESADAISEAQRVTILYNEVMTEAEDKVARMGTESLTASQMINALAASATNFLDTTARAISESPPLLEFLTQLADGADQGADRVQNLANKLGALVDTFGENPIVQAALFVTRQNLASQATAIGTLTNRATGGTFGRAVQRRDFLSAQEDIRGEIGAVTNPEEIRRAIDAQQKQIATLATLTDRTDEYNAAVETRNALVARLNELLKGTPDAPPDPLDDAEITRLQKIVEDFRRSQLSTEARRLEDLRSIEAAARTLGDTDALAAIQQPIAEAERAIERLNEGAERLQSELADLRPAVQSSFSELSTVGLTGSAQLDIFQRAYEQTIVRLKEQLKRGLLSDDGFEAAEKEAADKLNAQLLDLLDKLRAMGLLLPGIHAAIVAAFQGTEDASPLAESLGAIAGVARGILSTADAVGAIGENARRSLQGIIDVVDGIEAMNSAASTAAKIGAGFAIAGGAVALISGIFGKSAAEREREEAIRHNTEALAEMTQELRGFRITADTLSETRRGVQATLDDEGSILASHPGLGTKRFLEQLLEQFGISAGELDRVAAELGIEIRDGSGRLMREGLEQLVLAIAQAEAALVGYRDTVDDQRSRAERRADVLDEPDTAQSRLQRELDLLEHFRPGSTAGIDASTPEGRAAVEALVRSLLDQFEAGTLNLGNLTREEFLAIIDNLEAVLDEMTGGGVTGGGPETVRLGVSITEVQASQLLAIESTQLRELQQIRAYVAAMAGGVALPAPLQGAGGGSTTIGDLTIEFSLPNVRGGVSQETLIAAGRAGGAAAAETLRGRMAAAHHAAGAQGAPRVVVRTEG